MGFEEDIKAGFKCNHCDKTFGIASNRNRHVRRMHEGKSLDKSVTCSLCPYTCRDSFQLRVHHRSHTSSRPFFCTKCNNSFSRPEDLRRHGLKCNGPRHSCPTCSASFRSRAALDSHSIWAPGCGRLGTGVEREAVKLDLGRVALVGVDCQSLVDSEVFRECQRKRRYGFSSSLIRFNDISGRCGLCFSCTKATECGSCGACLGSDRRKKRCLAQACSRPLPFYRLKDQDPAPFGEVEEELVDDNSIEEAHRLWFETEDKGDELVPSMTMSTPDHLETAVLPDERVEVLTVELVNEELGGFREVAGDDQCITMNEDVVHY